MSGLFKQLLLQAQHKQSNQLAAAKMCALEGEDDLSDFMIEIDILSECKHPNIVELHEAYFIEGKLWVCFILALYLTSVLLLLLLLFVSRAFLK